MWYVRLLIANFHPSSIFRIALKQSLGLSCFLRSASTCCNTMNECPVSAPRMHNNQKPISRPLSVRIGLASWEIDTYRAAAATVRAGTRGVGAGAAAALHELLS